MWVFGDLSLTWSRDGDMEGCTHQGGAGKWWNLAHLQLAHGRKKSRVEFVQEPVTTTSSESTPTMSDFTTTIY